MIRENRKIQTEKVPGQPIKQSFEEMLHVQDLCVSYGDRQILKDVSFSVYSGQWFMIAGPNGAGKSTIINAVSRGVPYTGMITCRGKDVKSMRPQELARQVGILSQNHFVGYGYTVREVVGLGRYAYARGILGREDADFEEKVACALAVTGMEEKADQSVFSLSGGELQRTFLAQLFAQDPEILILDEPANHLDLVYQKQIFRLLREWLKMPGRAVISVVHDLSLARTYGSHGLLLRDGETVRCGALQSVMNRKDLEQTFSMDVYEWMKEMFRVWDWD